MSAHSQRTKKTLVFAPGKLGIEFAPVVDNGAVKQGCKVHAIDSNSKAKDKLAAGMILVAVNGNDVQQSSFVRILDLLALTKTQTRTLQFTAVAGAAVNKENLSQELIGETVSSTLSTDGSFQLHKLDDVASIVNHTMENPLVEAYSAKKPAHAMSATTPRGRALAPSNQQQPGQPQGSCTTPRKRIRPDTKVVLDKENETVHAPRTEPKKPIQHATGAATSDLSFGHTNATVCPSCSSYCKHVEYLASEVESLRAALRSMGAKHATMKQEIIHKRGYVKTVEAKLVACEQMLQQTRHQMEVFASEKEQELQQVQESHEKQIGDMQEMIDTLTQQNEEQQRQLQEMETAKHENGETEQLREELLQAQQKLKLRSGQCLLKEGQKQKAEMTYEAQLLEMQSMLEALKDSEMAMKQKLRQKDGRLMLLQAQLSKLRQGVECNPEPVVPVPAAATAVETAAEVVPEQSNTVEVAALTEEVQQSGEDDPEVQILDAEIQVELSRHEDAAALQQDIVERLQNEKDGLHALIQSLKADKDMRERIVETMRVELQSIITSHLEVKAELVENKETICRLNEERLQMQAQLAVIQAENKLWRQGPNSPNRVKRSLPASPEKTSFPHMAPAQFPLQEVVSPSQVASVVVAGDSSSPAAGCDDPTPVRVNSGTLRADPMNQSTQSLLRMVASQSPVTNESPSTPNRHDSLPLSGAHISEVSPFPGVETPSELHTRISSSVITSGGGLHTSMVSIPLTSATKKTPLSEANSSTSNRSSIQPVRTPPRSRSRDRDDEDPAESEQSAQSPSKTESSGAHSLSRFLERTYDSEMMADATLLDSSITLTPRGNSPVSVVSQISPSSFSTTAQTPTTKLQSAQLASPNVSHQEGIFPSPHNMLSSRRYLSSQMLYQILKSTPMKAQTMQDPMHATPALLRERALLSQQSPTQRVYGY